MKFAVTCDLVAAAELRTGGRRARDCGFDVKTRLIERALAVMPVNRGARPGPRRGDLTIEGQGRVRGLTRCNFVLVAHRG